VSTTTLKFIDFASPSHLFVPLRQLNNLTRFQMVKERSVPSLPTARCIAVLKGLCEDQRNTVFVVSGKERHSLVKSLNGIPRLGLAAEHGMFISWPTARTNSARKWETLVAESDRSWRALAISIMEVYTSRTHGSYIEETEMKVLWQYRDADTEFGSLQAKEMEDHLSKYLRGYAVDILHSGMKEGGYVEVRPRGVNKGVLAMKVIKRFPELAQKERIDFALVLGDDHCDEPMLSVVRQVGRRVCAARRAAKGEGPPPDMPATLQLVDVSSVDPYITQDLEVFTCTVGKKPSAAASYLHDVDEVLELLESLVKVSTRERYFSHHNLATFTSNLKVGKFDTSEETGLPIDEQPEMTEIQGGLMARSFSMSQVSAPRVRQQQLSTSLKEFLQPIDDDDGENFF
jgi:trehalose 6-phosphate synthase/phosphatase